MAVRADAAPWVVVAGGFHDRGGMDRANAALVRHLLDAGTPVHLVGHEIDRGFVAHPLTTTHVVRRPRGLPGIAERLLERAGVQVAAAVTRRTPLARVVVNGGNCRWPDINWVHALHAAWPVRDDGAAWWSRYRNTSLKALARRREAAAVGQARLVIANSDATRQGIVDRLGVSRERLRTVYLGSDPAWNVVEPTERAAARAAIGVPASVAVVAFVGALGSDINKGFDVLWSAWQQLLARGDWDAHLVVAGDGWRRREWQREAERATARGSVHFLGFTAKVREALAASDLLVSPVRYEAYGLNVHEALCCGLPVMVTRTAGVVERFDAAMAPALLPEAVTASDLADRLRGWRRDLPGWRASAASTVHRIRSRSWADMAAEIVDAAQDRPQRISA